MVFQLQSKDNQNEEWDSVSDEYGDYAFQTLEGAKSVESRFNDRFPLTEQEL
jgi:hypothetical protein